MINTMSRKISREKDHKRSLAKFISITRVKKSTDDNEICFANNLREARRNIGLSQRSLSYHTGIRNTLISNYEKSERLPNFRNLVLLATSLQVSIDWLVGRR